jgi:hypothetical protein
VVDWVNRVLDGTGPERVQKLCCNGNIRSERYLPFLLNNGRPDTSEIMMLLELVKTIDTAFGNDEPLVS